MEHCWIQKPRNTGLIHVFDLLFHHSSHNIYIYICHRETWVFCSLNLCFHGFYLCFYWSHQTSCKDVKFFQECASVFPSQVLDCAFKWSINWLVAIIISTANCKWGKTNWVRSLFPNSVYYLSIHLLFCYFMIMPAEWAVHSARTAQAVLVTWHVTVSGRDICLHAAVAQRS